MGGDGVMFEFCVYVQWDVNNHSALINTVGGNLTRQLETESLKSSGEGLDILIEVK